MNIVITWNLLFPVTNHEFPIRLSPVTVIIKLTTELIEIWYYNIIIVSIQSETRYLFRGDWAKPGKYSCIIINRYYSTLTKWCCYVSKHNNFVAWWWDVSRTSSQIENSEIPKCWRWFDHVTRPLFEWLVTFFNQVIAIYVQNNTSEFCYSGYRPLCYITVRRL